MKQTITKEDVKFLQGRFCIQLNKDIIYPDITDNLSFWLEKRISFISDLSFVGFYYTHKTANNIQEFVDYWNNPVKDRYYRLCTKKELEVIFNNMKEII
jgi:hypothetical protein